jgi:hypothetical protein
MLQWNSCTEHCGNLFDYTRYNQYDYCQETKEFLLTLCNISLFRRTGIDYLCNYLKPDLQKEFKDKITAFTDINGQSWETVNMFLSCYSFSASLENVLMDQRNVLAGTLLLFLILPSEITNNDKTIGNIQKDIKELLSYSWLNNYIKIIAFDLGCSSHALSEFTYEISNLLQIDVDRDHVTDPELFNNIISLVYNSLKYQHVPTLTETDNEIEIMNNIKEKQKTFCEYPNNISGNIYLNLLTDYVLSKYKKQKC